MKNIMPSSRRAIWVHHRDPVKVQHTHETLNNLLQRPWLGAGVNSIWPSHQTVLMGFQVRDDVQNLGPTIHTQSCQEITFLLLFISMLSDSVLWPRRVEEDRNKARRESKRCLSCISQKPVSDARLPKLTNRAARTDLRTLHHLSSFALWSSEVNATFRGSACWDPTWTVPTYCAPETFYRVTPENCIFRVVLWSVAGRRGTIPSVCWSSGYEISIKSSPPAVMVEFKVLQQAAAHAYLSGGRAAHSGGVDWGEMIRTMVYVPMGLPSTQQRQQRENRNSWMQCW